MRTRTVRRTAVMAALACAVALGAGGCGGGESDEAIAGVVDEHAEELLTIEGVAAVAVGRLPTGKSCVRIYVFELTDALRDRLPKQLEGHPVDIEVSGEFEEVGKAAASADSLKN